MCISAFGTCWSSSSSFVRLFIHSAFSPCFFCCCLTLVVRFPLHLVVGMFSFHLFPHVGKIFFRCFGMSFLVCIAIPFVYISLIILLSPLLSGLFLQIVQLLFSFVAFSFLSLHVPASFFCFIILACFRRCFSAFSVDFPILVLILSSCLLSVFWFSPKLYSPQHRLIHLIRLYYSLINKLVIDLLYSFPS